MLTSSIYNVQKQTKKPKNVCKRWERVKATNSNENKTNSVCLHPPTKYSLEKKAKLKLEHLLTLFDSFVVRQFENWKICA